MTASPNEIAAFCNGKEAFASASLAHKVAKRRRRSGVKQSYRCANCNQWHLGTPPERSRAIKRAFKATRSLTELQSLEDLFEEGVFS